MPTREQIIDYARTLIGTPYGHQQRLPGIGLDCLGVVLAIAYHFNLSDYDNITYPREGNGEEMIATFEEHLYKVDSPQLGDILVFKFRRHPQHVGILSSLNGEPTLIHAYSSIDRVAEHNFDESWQRRVCASYSFYPPQE